MTTRRDEIMKKLASLPRVDGTAFASATPPSIRLVIVGKITPSLNVTMRQHFGVRKKEGAEWAAHILYAARRVGRESVTDKAVGKRRLTIERHARKLLDQDNLAGGCKDLIDQIKRYGLIRDDRPDLCELVFRQEKITAKQKPHTVIILEDMP